MTLVDTDGVLEISVMTELLESLLLLFEVDDLGRFLVLHVDSLIRDTWDHAVLFIVISLPCFEVFLIHSLLCLGHVTVHTETFTVVYLRVKHVLVHHLSLLLIHLHVLLKVSDLSCSLFCPIHLHCVQLILQSLHLVLLCQLLIICHHSVHLMIGISSLLKVL